MPRANTLEVDVQSVPHVQPLLPLEKAEGQGVNQLSWLCAPMRPLSALRDPDYVPAYVDLDERKGQWHYVPA